MPEIFQASLFNFTSRFDNVQRIYASVSVTCDVCSKGEKRVVLPKKPYKNVKNGGAVYQFIFRGKQNCLFAVLKFLCF